MLFQSLRPPTRFSPRRGSGGLPLTGACPLGPLSPPGRPSTGEQSGGGNQGAIPCRRWPPLRQANAKVRRGERRFNGRPWHRSPRVGSLWHIGQCQPPLYFLVPHYISPSCPVRPVPDWNSIGPLFHLAVHGPDPRPLLPAGLASGRTSSPAPPWDWSCRRPVLSLPV